MKKLLMLLAVALMPSLSNGQNLRALFSFKTFYSPESGPYIETYLSVNTKSVAYKPDELGKLRGAIEVALIFKNESGIAHFDKYNLLAPEISESGDAPSDFLDQQRVSLRNGKYLLELTLTDKNVPEKPYRITQEIQVEYYPHLMAVSDIQLLDTYKKTETPGAISKSGYDLVTYVDNYYPKAISTLRFYAEVYNSDKILGATPFLINYYLESAESKHVMENLRGFLKQTPSKVNVVLAELPLTDLPSGNYYLVIEARNRENELLAEKSVFIQRNNTLPINEPDAYRQRDVTNTFASFITNRDTLADFIQSLYPICSPLEMTFQNNQLKLADLKIMQQFFYDFWVRRNPLTPEQSWRDYYAQVLIANKEFGNQVRKGYNTERGRVFLKYGPPNTLSKNYNEPGAYPYEIWHYYKLDHQTNRKFVFYNPDMISNDFVLLHSDAQGENYNNQWQLMVYKRGTPINDFDQENRGIDYFGGNKAGDNFSNPR